MVPGFNHNVMHKGKLFHIQTEDKGLQIPEIVTHLFVGGNIIDTRRTSYNDVLDAENLEELVREMMEEQHKSMLRDLKNAHYDQKVGGLEGVDTTVNPLDEQTSVTLDQIIMNYLAKEAQTK